MSKAPQFHSARLPSQTQTLPEFGHVAKKTRFLALFAAVFAILGIAILLSGCVMRPAESASIRAITPTEAVAINDEPTPASEIAPMGFKESVTILALSGGGADGAYGVGVLNGWTKTGKRPDFDIVTGVSTGGLMSVFAFLGPRYDAKLRQLYLSQTDGSIFTPRGPAGLLSDSIYDNRPLKRQIEREITGKVVDEVAAEHARGRRLYIATTNLDANELVVWDMGLLASGGGDGRTDRIQLFQKVLRASAAIPVLFPPVYIKPRRGVQLRQAHVDGGVKAPVLISDFLFEQETNDRTLYVIVNSSLALEDANSPVQPNLTNIASKAVGGLTRELTQAAVYRGYVRSLNSGTHFWLTAIPDRITPTDDPLDFDQKRLNALYRAGESDIQKPGFWWSSPPTLKRFDRIRRR